MTVLPPRPRLLSTGLLLPCLAALAAQAQNLNFPPATPSPAVAAGSQPALAAFNGKVYAAFRANDSSNILYVSSSTDGVNFGSGTAYPAIQMGSAPSLAVFNGRLYVGFQANDASHQLYLASSGDGVGFSPAAGYPDIQVGGAPSLAVLDNQLFIAFQANDAGHALYLARSSDGASFAVQRDAYDTLNGSPALAAFNNRLYLAFASNDNRNILYVTSTADGVTLPAATAYPGITVGGSPALAAANGSLYIAFQANDPSHLLYVTASSSGSNFPPASRSNGIQTGGTPGAAAFGAGLSLAFQANDSSNELYATANGGGSTGGGGGNGGGLPAHLLLGYWQDYTNGATPLTLAQVPTDYTIIAVAFGNSTGTPGEVGFSIDSGLSGALGGYSAAQFTNDIRTAHGRGQRVVLSVGGQNGNVSVTDGPSASAFANSVSNLINRYGFDGVDIDLEAGINPGQLAAAIGQLKQLQPNALVTAAPQTVDVQNTNSPYFQWATAIGSSLTMMNTQYYNSGTQYGCDGGIYAQGTENFPVALACIELQHLPASSIGLAFPASPSAAGGGYVDPSVAVASVQCLTSGTSCGSFHPPATWPGLRGVAVYSINWDASNGYNFSNTVAPALRALP